MTRSGTSAAFQAGQLALFVTFLSAAFVPDAMAESDLIYRDSFEARYSIGGTVSGLGNSAVEISLDAQGLKQNLILARNGNFVFSASVERGLSFSIRVAEQPSDRSCSVSQGQGVADSNVSDVQVDCVNPGDLAWDSGVWGQDWN